MSTGDYNSFLELIIGKQLRKRRTSLSLSLEELSERAKVNKQEIYYIEEGTIPASASVLYCLCEEMSVRMDDLLSSVVNEDNFTMN